MNKYQEALDYQTDKFLECVYSLDEGGLIENLEEGLKHIEKNKELLQELVNKETPTKIKNHLGDGFICPKCSKVICYDETTFDFNYCPACGQKLDWRTSNGN